MSQQLPTQFNLSLEEGKRYIEFGGGAKPVVRAGIDVRVDARPCQLPDGSPAVDFVVDLEKPFTEEYGQAIGSDEFDGAISVYALEHVGWRVLSAVLKEIRRVLKDNGSVFFLVPNTQAQMEHLLASQDWDDGGSMLFGGQDYGENAHKSFLTPSLITKLLQDAGFKDVVIQPFGSKGTDMVVTAHCAPRSFDFKEWVASPLPSLKPLSEAVQAVQEMADAVDNSRAEQYRKAVGTYDGPHPLIKPVSDEAPTRRIDNTPFQGEVQPHLKGLWITCPTEQQVQCAERFRRPYFDGGLPEGGGYQMYLDFPCHELTTRYILEHKPQSVLELGCGRGYVLKRLQDSGVIGHGWDISRHCILSRACEGITHDDATDPGRWALLVDHAYDLCFSVAFLDHVPEERLPILFSNMARACVRSIHGVNFDQSPGGDSTRLTRKPKEWWQARLPKGHVVVDKSEMEDGELPRRFIEGDGKLKLNVGSNLTMFHNGWVNIDTSDLKAFADHHRYRYLRHDVCEGLPYGTGTVDLIFCCHALTRLTYAEGFELLREFRRVIKPDGTVRIVVPSGFALHNAYNNSNHNSLRGGDSTPNLSEFDELSATVAGAHTPAEKLYALCYENHRSVYDLDTLTSALNRAGFIPILSKFREASEDGTAQILREGMDFLADISLFMSATPGSF